MLFEITHTQNSTFPSPEVVRREWLEFSSVSEAQRYCAQHSNREEFLRISKINKLEKS